MKRMLHGLYPDDPTFLTNVPPRIFRAGAWLQQATTERPGQRIGPTTGAHSRIPATSTPGVR
jgi:hypothetical protein